MRIKGKSGVIIFESGDGPLIEFVAGKSEMSISEINAFKSDDDGKKAQNTLPMCPHCGVVASPQVLQFDESYESHSFYQWEKLNNWMQEAECLVFVGVSFSVTLTKKAVEIATKRGSPVYNFNTVFDTRLARSRLQSLQIIGDCEKTLPALANIVKQKKA